MTPPVRKGSIPPPGVKKEKEEGKTMSIYSWLTDRYGGRGENNNQMSRQMPGTKSSTMVVALTKHVKAVGPDGGVNTNFSVRGFDSLSGRLKEKGGKKDYGDL